VNTSIAETYLRKWISWASRSRMLEIIKSGKTMKKHIDGILEAIRSGIKPLLLKALTTRSKHQFPSLPLS
jgi:transposase